MNKHVIIGILFLSMIFLLSSLALAQTPEVEPISIDTGIKDTTIDYTPYREIVVDEPGVVYHIRIKNTGTREKTYELVPNIDIIRNIGTYSIDPSDKITLEPGEEETLYFYLAVEKPAKDRTIIPIDIRSGLSETTIDLVARPIGPFLEQEQRTGWVATAFKVILIIVLVIIIIIALILSLRKVRKKEEPEEELPEFDEDIETYY
ncbi:hypothetical protein KY348_01010 [Candidatus Woesearchaeota archaeon]|nr:hypothetical protein [Candidatus Woesearchaeota archaeon]